LLRIPNVFFAVELEVFDLFIIVIFRGHPVNRDEVIIRITFLKLIASIDDGHDLENKIQGSREDIELMSGGYRKGFWVFEIENILFYFW
jgi:hypothetical protein